MKIICVDNFDHEGPGHDHVLVCENINEWYGGNIVEFLNNKLSGDQSPNFYRLVPNEYKLYEWEP